MRYEIQTAPVWDAFKQADGCPFCRLNASVTERALSQYLNEAVMEPSYRVQVNKSGFCAAHTLALYKGENKLGLSLQLSTRTNFLLSGLNEPKNAKAARKESARLSQSLSSCVVCAAARKETERYCKTAAQMYYNEPDFPALLYKTDVCLIHYASLLFYADYALDKAKEYSAALYARQTASLKKSLSALDAFADKFDHLKKSPTPPGGRDAALPDVINKLNGRIL